MALWVRTLREPVRGQSEGLVVPPTHPNPLGALFRELGAVLPPLTLWTLASAGAGARGILLNLALAAVCAGGAWALTSILGSAPQWIAMGIGLYAFFSWLQGLALRDRATFSMIYSSKAIVFGEIGFAWIAFVGYGFNFWTPPFFQRVHGVSVPAGRASCSASRARSPVCSASPAAAFSPTASGGRGPRARLEVGMITAMVSGPLALLMMRSDNVVAAYVFNFIFQLFSPFWIGSAIALANELVMPRMRATASAYYILAVTFIGLALGPYTMGQISDRMAKAGHSSGDALGAAMKWGLIPYALAFLFLWLRAATWSATRPAGSIGRALWASRSRPRRRAVLLGAVRGYDSRVRGGVCTMKRALRCSLLGDDGVGRRSRRSPRRVTASHLLPRRPAHPAGQLSDLSSRGGSQQRRHGGADVAAHLRRDAAVGEVDRSHGGVTRDAALVRDRSHARPVP